MKKSCVTHALLRIGKRDEISPNEQNIGAFTGFMARILTKEDQLQPYHFTTLSKSQAKSIIYALMEKAEAAAVSKSKPFIPFVGDQ